MATRRLRDTALRLSLFTSLALIAAMAGCSKEPPKDTGGGANFGTAKCIDRDEDGYGPGCALGADCNDLDITVTNQCYRCDHNGAGCACPHEGERIECGKVTSHDRGANTVTCGYGGQVCERGVWSECQVGAYAPNHPGLRSQGLGTPDACPSSEACDPYCKTVTDTSQGVVVDPDSGLMLTDGGLTLLRRPSTPTPGDLSQLQDAGALPEGGYIYHEMVPGEEATSPVLTIDTRVTNADVYFLLDTTSSMGDETVALTNAIADPTDGIIKRIKDPLIGLGPAAWIGMGRFEEYGTTPYVLDPSPNKPYQHLLSMQEIAAPALFTSDWSLHNAYDTSFNPVLSLHSGGDVPESTMSALFASGTGLSLYAPPPSPADYWNPPRTTWTTPVTGSGVFAPDTTGTGCGLGRTGYPCFRPLTTPIYVLITDAPSHNGPGGQYGYVNVTGYGIPGAQPFPAAVSASTLGGGAGDTFTAARVLPLNAAGTALTPMLIKGTVVQDAFSRSRSGVGGGVFTILDPPAGPYPRRERASLRDCSGATPQTICAVDRACGRTFSRTPAAQTYAGTALGNCEPPSIPSPTCGRASVASGGSGPYSDSAACVPALTLPGPTVVHWTTRTLPLGPSSVNLGSAAVDVAGGPVSLAAGETVTFSMTYPQSPNWVPSTTTQAVVPRIANQLLGAGFTYLNVDCATPTAQGCSDRAVFAGQQVVVNLGYGALGNSGTTPSTATLISPAVGLPFFGGSGTFPAATAGTLDVAPVNGQPSSGSLQRIPVTLGTSYQFTMRVAGSTFGSISNNYPAAGANANTLWSNVALGSVQTPVNGNPQTFVQPGLDGQQTMTTGTNAVRVYAGQELGLGLTFRNPPATQDTYWNDVQLPTNTSPVTNMPATFQMPGKTNVLDNTGASIIQSPGAPSPPNGSPSPGPLPILQRAGIDLDLILRYTATAAAGWSPGPAASNYFSNLWTAVTLPLNTNQLHVPARDGMATPAVGTAIPVFAGQYAELDMTLDQTGNGAIATTPWTSQNLNAATDALTAGNQVRVFQGQTLRFDMTLGNTSVGGPQALLTQWTDQYLLAPVNSAASNVITRRGDTIPTYITNPATTVPGAFAPAQTAAGYVQLFEGQTLELTMTNGTGFRTAATTTNTQPWTNQTLSSYSVLTTNAASAISVSAGETIQLDMQYANNAGGTVTTDRWPTSGGFASLPNSSYNFPPNLNPSNTTAAQTSPADGYFPVFAGQQVRFDMTFDATGGLGGTTTNTTPWNRQAVTTAAGTLAAGPSFVDLGKGDRITLAMSLPAADDAPASETPVDWPSSWPSAGTALANQPNSLNGPGGSPASVAVYAGQSVDVTLRYTDVGPSASSGTLAYAWGSTTTGVPLPNAAGTLNVPGASGAPAVNAGSVFPIPVTAGQVVTINLQTIASNQQAVNPDLYVQWKATGQSSTLSTTVYDARSINAGVAADTVTFTAPGDGNVFWGINRTAGDASFPRIAVSYRVDTQASQVALYARSGSGLTTSVYGCRQVLDAGSGTAVCTISNVATDGVVTWGVERLRGTATSPKVEVRSVVRNPTSNVDLYGEFVASTTATTSTLTAGDTASATKCIPRTAGTTTETCTFTATTDGRYFFALNRVAGNPNRPLVTVTQTLLKAINDADLYVAFATTAAGSGTVADVTTGGTVTALCSTSRRVNASTGALSAETCSYTATQDGFMRWGVLRVGGGPVVPKVNVETQITTGAANADLYGQFRARTNAGAVQTSTMAWTAGTSTFSNDDCFRSPATAANNTRLGAGTAERCTITAPTDGTIYFGAHRTAGTADQPLVNVTMVRTSPAANADLYWKWTTSTPTSGTGITTTDGASSSQSAPALCNQTASANETCTIGPFTSDLWIVWGARRVTGVPAEARVTVRSRVTNVTTDADFYARFDAGTTGQATNRLSGSPPTNSECAVGGSATQLAGATAERCDLGPFAADGYVSWGVVRRAGQTGTPSQPTASVTQTLTTPNTSAELYARFTAGAGTGTIWGTQYTPPAVGTYDVKCTANGLASATVPHANTVTCRIPATGTFAVDGRISWGVSRLVGNAIEPTATVRYRVNSPATLARLYYKVVPAYGAFPAPTAVGQWQPCNTTAGANVDVTCAIPSSSSQDQWIYWGVDRVQGVAVNGSILPRIAVATEPHLHPPDADLYAQFRTTDPTGTSADYLAISDFRFLTGTDPTYASCGIGSNASQCEARITAPSDGWVYWGVNRTQYDPRTDVTFQIRQANSGDADFYARFTASGNPAWTQAVAVSCARTSNLVSTSTVSGVTTRVTDKTCTVDGAQIPTDGTLDWGIVRRNGTPPGATNPNGLATAGSPAPPAVGNPTVTLSGQATIPIVPNADLYARFNTTRGGFTAATSVAACPVGGPYVNCCVRSSASPNNTPAGEICYVTAPDDGYVQWGVDNQRGGTSIYEIDVDTQDVNPTPNATFFGRFGATPAVGQTVHCQNAAGAGVAETCSYTAATAGVLNWGVRRETGSPTGLQVRVTSRKDPPDPNSCVAPRVFDPQTGSCCACKSPYTAYLPAAGLTPAQCCNVPVSTCPATKPYRPSTGSPPNCCEMVGCAAGQQQSGNDCQGRTCSQCTGNASGGTESCEGAPPDPNIAITCRTNACQPGSCGAGASCTTTPPAPFAANENCCTSTANCTPLAPAPDGAGRGEAFFKFTVPAGKRIYYHFALLKQGNNAADGSTDDKAFLYLKRASDTTTANGSVYDCNKDAATTWSFDPNRAKRSEINSWVEASTSADETFYVVVDNSADGDPTNGTYNYLLQVGQFEDQNYAAPTYEQTIARLPRGAKVIGIDSSGVHCGQARDANMAQYDTYDFLEKLARDTGTVNGLTGEAYVVPIRRNATDCATGTSQDGLKDAVVQAIKGLTRNLRMDLSARALYADQAVSANMVPGAPADFVKSVVARSSPDVTSNCQAPAIGPDDPVFGGAYTKFIKCLPGTNVQFDVTFKLPSYIRRQPYDQYFRFDVVTIGNETALLSRQAVVIKVPAQNPPGDFIRDYESTNYCPTGTHATWTVLYWDTDSGPSDPAAYSPNTSLVESSKIDFTVSVAQTAGELETATQVPLGTARFRPTPDTQVSSGNVEVALSNAGKIPRWPFLRVRMRLNPANDAAGTAPYLRAWRLSFSCRPDQ